ARAHWLAARSCDSFHGRKHNRQRFTVDAAMQADRGAAKHDFDLACASNYSRRFNRRHGRPFIGDHHRRKSWHPAGRSSAQAPGRLALAQSVPPRKQLLRPQAVPPRHIGDYRPLLATLRDNRQLLFVRPLPAPLHARDHLDPLQRRGLRFDPTVNIMVETIVAHGHASCPRSKMPGRCGKRTVNMREVVNALMYVLSTGCQWRAIPKDLPPRSTVHGYLDLWAWDGTLDRIHHALYVKCREQAQREASPT